MILYIVGLTFTVTVFYLLPLFAFIFVFHSVSAFCGFNWAFFYYSIFLLADRCIVTQLCPILCNALDSSQPGSFILGIFQARILKWIAISFYREYCRPRDWIQVSCTAGRFFTEPPGNQPWIFIGRTDAEAPRLRPSDVKSCLSGKDPDAGKDWRQKEMGTTEDEVVGWRHRLKGHKFEQTPGECEGQGGMACRSDGVTKRLKNSKFIHS